jgi:regulator of protease activity HflC (stomatin/prohibitin superfamily)
MSPLFIPVIFGAFVVLSFLRQVNQYERGVTFLMGRFYKVKQPGWRIVVPVFQSMRKVDTRLKAVDVPDQKALTKDNVQVHVNAVIYYKVADVEKAVLNVEDFYYAMLQFAQTSMRNAIGEVELDSLLADRAHVSDRIKTVVDAATLDWGIDVTSVELKDIALDPSMERTIAKQAEAERERRAVIITSEGEVAASENLAKAAATLSATPGALHIRTLQAINDVSSDQSNTIVFAVPVEVLSAFAKKGKE